jgi:hypothetical protein
LRRERDQQGTGPLAWCSQRPSGLAVAGETGLLDDEHAQRLCSIFTESGLSSLVHLRDLSADHASSNLTGGDRFDRLFAVGLNTVRSWSPEVIREEVVRLEARYPEIHALFIFVYLSLLETLEAPMRDMEVPRVEDAYHGFMCRVAEAPDVVRGRFFFDLPHAHQRVTFVECFRNALHDIVRRRIGAATREQIAFGLQQTLSNARRGTLTDCVDKTRRTTASNVAQTMELATTDEECAQMPSACDAQPRDAERATSASDGGIRVVLTRRHPEDEDRKSEASDIVPEL